MDARQINEYFTPRTQAEREVFDKQVEHKIKMTSFFALSVGAFVATPIFGLGILSVGAVGAGIYCAGRVYESYKLGTENLNLFHAMKKEPSVNSSNYQELTNVAKVINNKNSTIGNILDNIKKLRDIEQVQNNNSPKI